MYRVWTENAELWARMGRLAIESQMVIGMRVAGMMGLMPQRSDEPMRMISEKIDATLESGEAMVGAMTKGQRPDQIFAAGIKPYQRRASANAKRLSRQS